MLKNLILFCISIALGLLFIEFALRMQDRFGPIVRLSGFEETLGRWDLKTHHKRVPPHRPRIANATGCEEGQLKLLFLGDSWIEEGGVVEGAISRLEEQPEIGCVKLYNGGVGSYSPSLLTLQGVDLIRANSIDFVFVNIDETDLMDEYLRYRHGSLRGARGDLIAVVPTQVDFPQLSLGLIERHQPLHILRLIEKTYFTRIMLPRLREEFYADRSKPTFENIFAPQRSADPWVEFRAELNYFSARLSEMLGRFRLHLGTPDKIVITHHPHFLNVVDDKEHRYNNVVSEVIKNVAQKHDVSFFDATEHYGTLHDVSPHQVFRWPEDPFSHLTHGAYVKYGYAIVDRYFNRLLSSSARK